MRLRLILALLSATPVIALADTAPSSGRQAPPAQSAVQKPAAPVASRLPQLAPLTTSLPLQDPAECRATCAQSYYVCLAGQDSGHCGTAWSECTVACDNPDTLSGLSDAR